MALIPCSECGQQVSDTAGKCPQCGAKVARQTSWKRISATVAGFFVLVAIFGGGPGGRKPPQSSSPPIAVTSLELARAYEQNEAAADATYKGRTLNVTGTVTDIVKDVFDDTVVRLEGGNMLFGVSAELKPSEEQRAIALRKGQELTVQCMGRGEVVSMPMLDECTIETPPGQAERSGSAQGAAQRTSSEQSAASIETRLVGLNGQDRGKVCAVFGQNLPNFYDEVEELGMSRAMAKWETERDEVLASGNPENIAAMAEFDLFLPGILKHVAEAHSMPGQSGIDPRKHATDAYVAECVRLGPENVK